jgi:hypothetical protein
MGRVQDVWCHLILLIGLWSISFDGGLSRRVYAN